MAPQASVAGGISTMIMSNCFWSIACSVAYNCDAHASGSNGIGRRMTLCDATRAISGDLSF